MSAPMKRQLICASLPFLIGLTTILHLRILLPAWKTMKRCSDFWNVFLNKWHKLAGWSLMVENFSQFVSVLLQCGHISGPVSMGDWYPSMWSSIQTDCHSSVKTIAREDIAFWAWTVLWWWDCRCMNLWQRGPISRWLTWSVLRVDTCR